MSKFEYKRSYHRNLPHFQPPGATMFITFRLAGSIPAETLRQLAEERQNIERQLAQIRNKQAYAAHLDLEERKFFGKWDRALDLDSNGPFWLRDETIAKLIVDSLHYQDNNRYRLDAFTVMPNHVHLVCTPLVQFAPCSPRRDLSNRFMSHHVYILKCSDNSYYVGMTANVERRVKEHQKGYRDRSYTSTRRPVELVWSTEFPTRREAFRFEQQVKGWTRAKKQALIHGEPLKTRATAKPKRKTRERGSNKSPT